MTETIWLCARCERDAADGFYLAVGDVEIFDLEHGDLLIDSCL
jgi:hypothetical protein